MFSSAGSLSSSLSATPTPSKSSFNTASLPSATSLSSYGGTFAYGRSLGFQWEGTAGSKSDAETESCQDSGTSSAHTGGDSALEHTQHYTLVHVFSDTLSATSLLPAEGTTGEVPPPEHLFIQMELCREDSLQDWLRANWAARSRRKVLQYFEQVGCPMSSPCRSRASLDYIPPACSMQILDAVCYVHQQGMMHRDLKVCS